MTDTQRGGRLQRMKAWAHILRRDSHAIYFAARDPRVPWYAKILAVAVAAYALSPIDLIPDFIPVLGYLDDLIIVPAGIWLVVALIPPDVMRECRAQADTAMQRPSSKLGLTIIIALWILATMTTGYIVFKTWPSFLHRMHADAPG
jgi:uncharacterized membrane protein YkvA (DUF1232 family)